MTITTALHARAYPRAQRAIPADPLRFMIWQRGANCDGSFDRPHLINHHSDGVFDP